jgi:hypothetical protein
MADISVPKRLWLHIGTEKTGTKTIQAVCRVNREQLMRGGILYPQTPGKISHIKLTLFAADEGRALDLRRRAQIAAAEDFHQFKSSFLADLQAEIAASGCHTVCLSNENLASRIRRPQDIDRLADALRPLADSIGIIVYLRPQHDLFVSRYSTWVKGGRTEPMMPPTNEMDRKYNYDRMLSGWANAFGEENIRVRIFDRKQFVDGDLLKDFFSVLDYSPSQELTTPRDQNTSLDADILEFLMLFNKHVSKFSNDSLNPERGNVSRALEAISRGDKVHVPEATLRGIADMFEASNAKVAARFLNRRDGILFPNMNFEPAPESKPLTVERVVEIAAHLWQWQQEKFLKVKTRRGKGREAKGRRAPGQGRPGRRRTSRGDLARRELATNRN